MPPSATYQLAAARVHLSTLAFSAGSGTPSAQKVHDFLKEQVLLGSSEVDDFWSSNTSNGEPLSLFIDLPMEGIVHLQRNQDYDTLQNICPLLSSMVAKPGAEKDEAAAPSDEAGNDTSEDHALGV